MSRKKLRTALLEEQNFEGRTKPHERKFREKRDEATRAIKRQEGGANWAGWRSGRKPSAGSFYNLRKTLKTNGGSEVSEQCGACCGKTLKRTKPQESRDGKAACMSPKIIWRKCGVNRWVGRRVHSEGGRKSLRACESGWEILPTSQVALMTLKFNRIPTRWGAWLNSGYLLETAQARQPTPKLCLPQGKRKFEEVLKTKPTPEEECGRSQDRKTASQNAGRKLVMIENPESHRGHPTDSGKRVGL